jgi:hypothetical protein
MAKGYTVEEILSKRERGITGAGTKWEENALAGQDRYADWLRIWLPQVYSVVATLPSKEGKSTEKVLLERVAPVVNRTKRIAEAYRKDKVKRLVELVK